MEWERETGNERQVKEGMKVWEGRKGELPQ